MEPENKKEDITQIEHLLKEVQVISESYERVAEATGENFNIFSIMRMESDEVATHSRFIAELLNPRGSHGQKDKFLLIFKRLFAADSEIMAAKCKVSVEYAIGKVEVDKGGRLDILIKDEQVNVIMIENKIYAAEQENQLLRYHKAFPKGKLFYLTLFGEESYQESSKNIYEPISYKTHIISWLEECKKEAVSIPILRESISQYINLIKKLTNQNLNKKMSQDITKRVLKDEDSLNAFKALVNSKYDVFREVLQENLLTVLKKIANREDLELNVDENLINGSGKWMSFSFSNNTLKDLQLKFLFWFQVPSGYREFSYGFAYLDTNSKVNPNYPTLKEKFADKFGAFKESPNLLCWNYYENYRNWEDIDIWRKIRFGDFESDLNEKVRKMVEIITAL